MTVRAIEARLPAGFSTGDLGEATVMVDQSGRPEYPLVSTQTTPLPVGFEADYVVFVLNDADILRYDWTIELIGQGVIALTQTSEGHVRPWLEHVGTSPRSESSYISQPARSSR